MGEPLSIKYTADVYNTVHHAFVKLFSCFVLWNSEVFGHILRSLLKAKLTQ